MYNWCRKCYWAISSKGLKLLYCRWLLFFRKTCGQTVYNISSGTCSVICSRWNGSAAHTPGERCCANQGAESFSSRGWCFQRRLRRQEGQFGVPGWGGASSICWTRIQINRADRVCGNVKSISSRVSSTRQIGADRHWMHSRHWPLSQLLQSREHLKLAFSQPQSKPMGKGAFRYILAEFRLNRDTFFLPKFN